MPLKLADLCAEPNPLAQHYQAFGVDRPDRLLLSGHSHQAWPDVAREGMLEAFGDAADTAGEKWSRASERADQVREGFAAWLGEPDAQIALGASTHELVLRFLSALALERRPRLISTDGEFHTLRRQLLRLGEAGVELIRLPARPVGTLAERLAAEIDDRTSAVMISAVLYETSEIVGGLGSLARECERCGVEFLIDAYHALGPVRWSMSGIERAWVVGGGYKYLQLGEGNCLLRLPPHSDRFRPTITGWHAEFADLSREPDLERVGYGDGAVRFAGATYDPTSHYRAARVQRFFHATGLTPDLLAANYRRQVDLLADRFDALGLPVEVIAREREIAAEQRGGFLALRSPHAAALQQALQARGVLTDSRGESLRLGPAPYLTDSQLEAGIAALAEAATAIAPGSRS